MLYIVTRVKYWPPCPQWAGGGRMWMRIGRKQIQEEMLVVRRSTMRRRRWFLRKRVPGTVVRVHLDCVDDDSVGGLWAGVEVFRTRGTKFSLACTGVVVLSAFWKN